MNNKLTTLDFINKSKEKYGDLYDYSKTEYKGNKIKTCVICTIHGEFWQTLYNHLEGNGCPKCAYLKGASEKASSIEKFIKKANGVHNNFYSYDNVIYNRAKIKVKIMCPIHDEFEQTPDHHLSGAGCPECAKNYNYTTKEWVIKASIKHNYKYDYSKVNYINAKVKVCIICLKHEEFWQLPGKHLFGDGCPCCSSSKGEQLIYNWLKENQIPFKTQLEIEMHKIARNSNKIVIDFFVKYNNKQYFIEYDGKQHYEYIPFFHKGGIIDFEKQQNRDDVLNAFCKLYEDKIILIRFKYNESSQDILNQLNKLILTNGNNN